MTSAAATAAAQDTALPAYVPPIEPGFSLSVSSFRLMMALSGKPFARPYPEPRMRQPPARPRPPPLPAGRTFAQMRMSGRTPEYSML